MKWQKNTGVMPCEGETYVEIRYSTGQEWIGKARCQEWDLREEEHVTHWCIAERVPFDYVEPKVWTVEFGGNGNWIDVNKNGTNIYQILRKDRAFHAIDYLIDALYAWEERNGTK